MGHEKRISILLHRKVLLLQDISCFLLKFATHFIFNAENATLSPKNIYQFQGNRTLFTRVRVCKKKAEKLNSYTSNMLENVKEKILKIFG